jgi:hypothetical protein
LNHIECQRETVWLNRNHMIFIPNLSIYELELH